VRQNGGGEKNSTQRIQTKRIRQKEPSISNIGRSRGAKRFNLETDGCRPVVDKPLMSHVPPHLMRSSLAAAALAVFLMTLGLTARAAPAPAFFTASRPDRDAVAAVPISGFFPAASLPVIDHVLADYHRVCRGVLGFSVRSCHPRPLAGARLVAVLTHYPQKPFVGETSVTPCDDGACAQIELLDSVRRQTPWGRYLILHEIGHAYGLTHDDGDRARVMRAVLPQTSEVTWAVYRRALEDVARLVATAPGEGWAAAALFRFALGVAPGK
jgi:hypothetical protein